MTDALDVMRAFVESYPDFDVLGDLMIDYTSNVPNSAGLFPSGLVEVNRRTDIFGNVESDRQANFALYAVLTKSPDDDVGATYNAEWLMGFQEWVLEQSARGLAPRFGDVPEKEGIVAQNGQVYESDAEGWAMYAIQISASFTKRYERS